MKSLILFGCLTPLLIVFIILKLSVWVSATNAEKNYVGKESSRKRGPYVVKAYADVDEDEEEYGDRTDYR